MQVSKKETDTQFARPYGRRRKGMGANKIYIPLIFMSVKISFFEMRCNSFVNPS